MVHQDQEDLALDNLDQLVDLDLPDNVVHLDSVVVLDHLVRLDL